MQQEYAFLFDMDGVIVDSNPIHKVALKQFCEKYGYTLSDEQLHNKIYGRTNKDWIPVVFGNVSSEEIARYTAEKEQLFRDMYADSIQPLKGLLPFLQKLDHYGLARAIATSAPRENVDFTLERTRIGAYFEVILDESYVERGKPDPDIYLKTAAALGFDPKRCIVLEDSLSGVKSGKSAGCKVVALTTTHTKEELLDADMVIKDFDGMDPLELIDSLF
jgi:HAD superfamily hydrolase (TIGR01509 family)